MNRSKCKKCKKWHPKMSDISGDIMYSIFAGCKCNAKVITAAIRNKIAVIKLIKGRIIISKKDMEMLVYLLED